MENIYSYNWFGKRTGWEYRVVFKKASSSPISDFTEIKLPRGSFTLKLTKWEYDKYPIGLHSAKTLEAEINLSMLESSNYDDFITMLYNPVLENSKTIYVTPTTYLLGTIIEFYIKYNNNAEESVNVFRKIMVGIFQEEFENESSNSLERIFKLKAEDINRVLATQTSFVDLAAINNLDDVERQGYIDYYINSTTNKSLLHVAQAEHSFLFQPFTTLETYINMITQTLYRDLIRDSAPTYSIDLPIPRIYRQLYDGTGNKGTLLAKSDLYLLTTMYFDVTPVNGLYNNEDEDSINKTYQSLWDFLTDYYQNTLRRAWTTEDGIKSAPLFGYTDSEIIATVDLNKVEISYKQMSSLLKKVTSSMTESRGETIKDIDNFPAELTASRNANEFTIPILFNTMPTQDGWMQWDWLVKRGLPDDITPRLWLNSIGITPDSKVFGGYEYRRFGLYYKEQPSFCSNPELFRVHEYASYLLEPGNYTEGYTPHVPLDLTANDFINKEAIVVQLQEKSSPQILADNLLKVFSKKEQHTAKIKTRIEYLTQFIAGGANGYIWDNPNTKLIIDLSQIDSRKTMYYDEWYIISSSIDYVEEIAELEIILKVI